LGHQYTVWPPWGYGTSSVDKENAGYSYSKRALHIYIVL